MSEMAAAQFLDTFSKLLGMTGETSDAISAYTQVKRTEAPRLSQLPNEHCPEIWIFIPLRQRPNSWDKNESPVVPFEGNLYGQPLADLLWEVLFE